MDPENPHPQSDAVPKKPLMTPAQLRDASDATLVIAVGRYQQDALAEAYRRHAGAVFALARRLLSDKARAEEITQEVFLRLWNDPDRFDPNRGTLRTYLLAQCHGRAVDLIRSDTAHRRREEKELQQAAESGYDLEHEVWDMAVNDRVRAVVSSLPADEREPIVLAYFGGHTYREVADLLDIAEGTIKSRIRAGLKRMRAELNQAGIGVPT